MKGDLYLAEYEEMNRTDLQRLSEARVADAEILLLSQRWAAAYYLLGYAVECALKACAAGQFRQDEVPPRALVNDFYTHRLEKLLAISGAQVTLETRVATDPGFRYNWSIVLDWNETSRYDDSTTEAKAREMFVAVADQAGGVLPWLRTQW